MLFEWELSDFWSKYLSKSKENNDSFQVFWTLFLSSEGVLSRCVFSFVLFYSDLWTLNQYTASPKSHSSALWKASDLLKHDK